MRKVFLFEAIIALLVCLVPSPALADGPYTYTLNVPSSISIPETGMLNRLVNNNSDAQTISCTTDDPTMHNATVAVKGTNAGKLTSGGSVSLSTALKLSGTGFTTVNALSGTDQTLVDATQGALSGGTWSINTLVITQPPFDAADPGIYSTIITFTATFNP